MHFHFYLKFTSFLGFKTLKYFTVTHHLLWKNKLLTTWSDTCIQKSQWDPRQRDNRGIKIPTARGEQYLHCRARCELVL